MDIQLLAFASATDAIGRSELLLTLPEGATVATLLTTLGARYPALGPLLPHLAVAIDGAVAPPDEVIPPGAEVALLPPVSGG